MYALYSSRSYPQHWFVRLNDRDWMIFPAKIDGWKEAHYQPEGPPADVVAVPLRLAFHTGLLEAVEQRMRRAVA